LGVFLFVKCICFIENKIKVMLLNPYFGITLKSWILCRVIGHSLHRWKIKWWILLKWRISTNLVRTGQTKRYEKIFPPAARFPVVKGVNREGHTGPHWELGQNFPLMSWTAIAGSGNYCATEGTKCCWLLGFVLVTVWAIQWIPLSHILVITYWTVYTPCSEV